MAEGQSAAASIAYRGTLVAVAATFFGLVGIQLRLLDPITGFYLFSFGTLVGGLFAFLMGLVAIVATRQDPGSPGQRRARVATVGGAALLGIVLLSGLPGKDFPPINDITTNLADPPAFAPASRVPAYAEFDMSYPAEFVDIVRESYPDLATLELGVPPAAAYDQSLATARGLGWEITDSNPGEGRFDASQTTQIFRFVDDIAVRIRPLGNGSAVDIRSRSRVGRGDLGANAIRIREFADALTTQ